MRPTLFRRAQYGTQSDGFGGIHPWQTRAPYEVQKSKYGPQYKIAPHIHGLNPRLAVRYSIMTGLFGLSAGIFAVFFFNAVPRVREDILEKVPVVGEFFHHEVPPEDNPF